MIWLGGRKPPLQHSILNTKLLTGEDVAVRTAVKRVSVRNWAGSMAWRWQREKQRQQQGDGREHPHGSTHMNVQPGRMPASQPTRTCTTTAVSSSCGAAPRNTTPDDGKASHPARWPPVTIKLPRTVTL